MSHKLAVIGAVAAATLLFPAATAIGQDYANTTASARVLEGITVSDGSFSLLLSPNGTRIYRTENERQCLFDIEVDPPSPISCDEMARVGRSEELLWSPNGEKLLMPTFSDAILAMKDSDIMILDPATWTRENLTNDGFDDYLFGGPAFMDFSGQWMDDDTVLFIRYDIPANGIANRGQAALMEIDLDREVREVFAPLAPGGLVYGLALSPDKTRVAFVNDDPDDNPKLNGIHIYELGGKPPQRILGVADVGGLVPFHLSFSADGKYLLALREHPEQNAGTIAMVIDLKSRAVTHVTAPDRTVYGVAWSPTGSALAYVAARYGDTDEGPGGLYIADPPDAPGRLVLPGPYDPPICCGNNPFLWATNDTMILENLGATDKPVLVQLQR